MPIVYSIGLIVWGVIVAMLFLQRMRANRSIKASAKKTGAPAETLSFGGFASLAVILLVLIVGVGSSVAWGVQQIVF